MTVLARTNEWIPNYLPTLDRAVSDTAQALGEAVRGEALPSSVSWTDQHISRGERIVADAVAAGRKEGFEAAGTTIDLACALIWALPPHVPLPDVWVESDGDIVFDWSENADRVLSLSVGPTGYIGYASLIGLQPDYGRAPSFGSLPDTLLFHLLRLYPLPGPPG